MDMSSPPTERISLPPLHSLDLLPLPQIIPPATPMFFSPLSEDTSNGFRRRLSVTSSVSSTSRRDSSCSTCTPRSSRSSSPDGQLSVDTTPPTSPPIRLIPSPVDEADAMLWIPLPPSPTGQAFTSGTDSAPQPAVLLFGSAVSKHLRMKDLANRRARGRIRPYRVVFGRERRPSIVGDFMPPLSKFVGINLKSAS